MTELRVNDKLACIYNFEYKCICKKLINKSVFIDENGIMRHAHNWMIEPVHHRQKPIEKFWLMRGDPIVSEKGTTDIFGERIGDNRFINLEGEIRILSKWNLDRTWSPPVKKLSFSAIDELDDYTVQRALGLSPIYRRDIVHEQAQSEGYNKGPLVK
ncbi:TPA_asm: hypothetical protein GIN61_08375 [Listeria monocytogenes]|nr:hypothetical protein [Listeria monocytogenes]EKG5451783.1 hypothetical protein [Listeria monocytogenes]HAA6170873.1 hypothetical protein [Listeria monocytogenes]HAA9026146.1 hypothetical protein [Listeria monocytogenes]HAB0475011.1 hypothetical protein [Listeria monocytogenes]